MAESIDLRSVTKFEGSNFQAWKFQLKAILVANELTSIVDGTEKQPGGTETSPAHNRME